MVHQLATASWAALVYWQALPPLQNSREDNVTTAYKHHTLLPCEPETAVNTSNSPTLLSCYLELQPGNRDTIMVTARDKARKSREEEESVGNRKGNELRTICVWACLCHVSPTLPTPTTSSSVTAVI